MIHYEFWKVWFVLLVLFILFVSLLDGNKLVLKPQMSAEYYFSQKVFMFVIGMQGIDLRGKKKTLRNARQEQKSLLTENTRSKN